MDAERSATTPVDPRVGIQEESGNRCCGLRDGTPLLSGTSAMKAWSSLLQKMMISYRIMWLSPKSLLDEQVSHLFHVIGLCLGALWLDSNDFNDVCLCENMVITPNTFLEPDICWQNTSGDRICPQQTGSLLSPANGRRA